MQEFTLLKFIEYLYDTLELKANRIIKSDDLIIAIGEYLTNLKKISYNMVNASPESVER